MSYFKVGAEVHLMQPYGGCSSDERYVIKSIGEGLVTLREIPIQESPAEQNEILLKRAEESFAQFERENLTEN